MMRARWIPWALAVFLGLSCSTQERNGAITASGTIEAVEINVSSKASGQLLEVLVEEGDEVEPGRVLAVVDHAAWDIQLRQAEAGAELARAQLRLLRSGARREDIEQAEAALRQAEASLDLARADAHRMSELAAKGAVTPKQREDAEARLTVAEAQRKAALEALSKLRRLARPEEIQAAEARLAQAEAGVDLLRKTIADCTIAAPTKGTVTHKAAEAGEIVAAGATIVTLTRLDPVFVMIYLPERDVGRVRLGDAAEVRIDAFPGRPFPGRVTYISPQAEFTPKNVQTKDDRVKLVFGVKIEIANPQGWLKPGLPADAVIRAGAPGR